MSEWKERYGSWAGNREGTPPDFSRCAEEVFSGRGMHHQCGNKATVEPDEQGRPTKCRVHSKAFHDEKAAEADRRYRAERKRNAFQWNGRRFYEALKLIADGHNDPRAVAEEAISIMKQYGVDDQ